MKLGQKSYFLAHFKSFFVYALLHPMTYAPRFCQMKYLIKIYLIFVKLKNFKVFCTDSTSMKWLLFGFFWALTPQNIVQSCWNCPLWSCQKVIKNSHIVYNRSIPLYLLDAKFPFLCICCSQLYLKKQCIILVQDPIGTILRGARGRTMWGNDSSKKRQIELKFWTQVVLIVVQMPFKAPGKTRF